MHWNREEALRNLLSTLVLLFEVIQTEPTGYMSLNNMLPLKGEFPPYVPLKGT